MESKVEKIVSGKVLSIGNRKKRNEKQRARQKITGRVEGSRKKQKVKAGEREMVQKGMERLGRQIKKNRVNRSGNGWKGAERS